MQTSKAEGSNTRVLFSKNQKSSTSQGNSLTNVNNLPRLTELKETKYRD